MTNGKRRNFGLSGHLRKSEMLNIPRQRHNELAALPRFAAGDDHDLKI
jgi:hypothetical protein